MKSFLLDPCSTYKKDQGLLMGVTGIIVDDTIDAGNLAFIKEEDQKSERFVMNPKQISCFEFSGMRIEQRGSTISLEQQDYISGINRPSAIKPDSKVFQTIRGKISWCVHSTRPDVAYYGAKLAQIKAEKVTVDEMKLLRRAVRALWQRSVQLKHRKLDLNTISLAVYSDAGFATNWDMSSQLGFIVLLVDDSKKCSILHWNS